MDGADKHHAAVLQHLNDRAWRWIVPALCVAEAAYIVGRKYGPMVEADFVMGWSSIEVRAPERDDWAPIAATIRRYHGFNIGAADASIMQLSERFNTATVLTLDRRHFGPIRPNHRRTWNLLPEL